MQVVFIATATDREFPYVPVQAVSLIGSVLLVLGAFRWETSLLVTGFAINALGRVAQIAFQLSRLHILLGLALAIGWVWAAVAAASRRDPPVSAAVWFLGAVHVASMFYVLGRFNAAAGLALGATGLLLAAPALSQRR
jgi:hypothetical protein